MGPVLGTLSATLFKLRKLLLIGAACVLVLVTAFLFFGKSTSVLNGAKPIKFVKYASVAELPMDWCTLPVTSGQPLFNPVYLPFSYSADGVTGDNKQALTFPALLSFKMEFANDACTQKFPLEVFLSDPTSQQISADPASIAAFIAKNQANHAVGGQLVEHKNGFTGKLQVFDQNGQPIFSRDYPTHLPYYTLMGRMALDAATDRKQTFTPQGAKELERPMTANMNPVRALGELFKTKWRSPEEWTAYIRVLAMDKDFAELHYFFFRDLRQFVYEEKPKKNTSLYDLVAPYFDKNYVMRRSLNEMRNSEHTLDIILYLDDAIKVENARALASHLVMPALRGGDPSCNIFSDAIDMDSRLATLKNEMARGKQAYLRAKQIFSRHNTFTNLDLGPFDPEWNTLSPATLAALKNNEKSARFWPRLHREAQFAADQDNAPRAIPLALSALQSNWRPDFVDYGEDYEIAARSFWQTGHPGAAQFCIEQYAAKYSVKSPTLRWIEMLALRDFLHLNEASRAAEELSKPPYADKRALVLAYLTAAESGEKVRMKALASRLSGLSEELQNVIQMRKAANEGDVKKCREFYDSVEVTPLIPPGADNMVNPDGQSNASLSKLALDTVLESNAILADAYVRAKRERAGYPPALRAWQRAPRMPRLAMLLLATGKQKHKRELFRIAEVMCWIAPEVPYWQEFARQVKKAGGEAEGIEQITALLNSSKPGDLASREAGDIFLTEYFLLQALRSQDKAIISKAMEAFLAYAQTQSTSSSIQRSHLWSFFSQATKGLDQKDVKRWQNTLNKNLDASAIHRKMMPGISRN